MSVAQMTMGRGRPTIVRRAASLGVVSWIAVTICTLLTLTAIFAPLIAPHDPTAVDPLNAFAPAGSAHWLGTDDTGRDIFSRLVFGARPSLAGPALVIVIATTVGTSLAIAGAWFGGWIDAGVARVLEIVFAFPGLILAVVAAALFGAGFIAPVLALSIAYVPVIARVLRSAAIKERKLPYIAALQVQGASGWSICLRHLLPNLLPLIVVQAAIGFGYAMLDLAAISFLGLGIQPPSPDWGVMIAGGQPAILDGNPQQSLYAALTVVIAVVSFNLVGERLAQHFDVEERA